MIIILYFSQTEEIIEICDDTEERTSRGTKLTGSMLNGETTNDVSKSWTVFLELFYGGYFSKAPANVVIQLVLFVLVGSNHVVSNCRGRKTILNSLG